jgi:hypothetical protein
VGKKHSRKKQQVSQKFLLQYSHKVEKKTFGKNSAVSNIIAVEIRVW